MKHGTSILERKGVRRVMHRSGTSKNHRNVYRNFKYFTLVGVLFLILLWFTIVVKYSATVIAPPVLSLLGEILEEPIWTPYDLTPLEVLTGHFTDKAIYTGVYQYTQISNVSTDANTAVNNTSRYRIFFPMDYQSEKTYTNTTNVGRNYSPDESLSTYLVSHPGNKGHQSPNQDRSIFIQDYKYHRSENPQHHSNDLFIAALFDGHGDLGHVTSHVAVTELPVSLLQSIQMNDISIRQSTTVAENMIPTLIKKIFHTIDTKSVIAQVPRGGSTAVLVVHHQNTVYIASAGDSTAYLIQWFERTANNNDTASSTTTKKELHYSIVKSAVQHKPSSPLERKRIETNGGHVYIPRQGSHESSRVVYKSLNEAGEAIQTGLAMSRSLGDTAAKELRVVICEPDIVTYTFPDPINIDLTETHITNDNYFVIVASDGVMDVTELDDLVVPIGMTLYDKSKSSATTGRSVLPLRAVCHSIVQRAIDAWNQATGNQYRDDITLLVHKIR